MQIQTKLFVDKEKKVCVCRVYEVLDVWTDINNKKHYELRDLTSAKVTCKDGDEFDERKGKQMAYARAMIKASEKVIRRNQKWKKRLLKEIAEYDATIEHNLDVQKYYQEEYEKLAN